MKNHWLTTKHPTSRVCRCQVCKDLFSLFLHFAPVISLYPFPFPTNSEECCFIQRRRQTPKRPSDNPAENNDLERSGRKRNGYCTYPYTAWLLSTGGKMILSSKTTLLCFPFFLRFLHLPRTFIHTHIPPYYWFDHQLLLVASHFLPNPPSNPGRDLDLV